MLVSPSEAVISWLNQPFVICSRECWANQVCDRGQRLPCWTRRQKGSCFMIMNWSEEFVDLFGYNQNPYTHVYLSIYIYIYICICICICVIYIVYIWINVPTDIHISGGSFQTIAVRRTPCRPWKVAIAKREPRPHIMGMHLGMYMWGMSNVWSIIIGSIITWSILLYISVPMGVLCRFNGALTWGDLIPL